MSRAERRATHDTIDATGDERPAPPRHRRDERRETHRDAVEVAEPVSLGVSIGEPYSGSFVWSVCGTHWVAHRGPDAIAVAITISLSLCIAIQRTIRLPFQLGPDPHA